MFSETVAWLQHIHKLFGEARIIKAIIVMNFITPSILSQSSDRDYHGKVTKKI